MPYYEHTFIARPDLSGTQAQSLAEELTKLIQENGGEVKKSEYWGLRTLAYRVKKNRKGHYLHMNVEAPASTIFELERNERIHDDVIRYLTVKVDDHDDNPSIFMQARNSRDDRRRDRN
ncbi:MAG: 30S ribosomal protein S6 [Geminicoccaceae bacterium]|nr:30S ribosomal protein S6 [Geminicoccaceae bacterium]